MQGPTETRNLAALEASDNKNVQDQSRLYEDKALLASYTAVVHKRSPFHSISDFTILRLRYYSD